jgi:hypothetical protein
VNTLLMFFGAFLLVVGSVLMVIDRSTMEPMRDLLVDDEPYPYEWE